MKSETKRIIIVIIATCLITFMASTSFYFVMGTFGLSEMATVQRAAEIIQKNFYKDIDKKKLYDGAIKGMMESLNDEYSWYVDKPSFKELSSSLDGAYTGIGVVVTIDPADKLITVISPIEDTPAEKAGLNTGDKIVSINGIVANESNYRDAINSMRGNADLVGQKIELIIRKKGSEKEEPLALKREKIIMKTVKHKKLDGDIAYVRITNFDMRTSDEFDNAINSMGKASIKGLVLDLRNNPGGILDSTEKIANQLLPEGMITYFMYRDGSKQEFKADGKNFWDIPIVVLINGGSASASEVISGALKDRNRATLVGTKSFGKGVVQSILPLTAEKDGQTAIYITTARYYTPNGICIDKTGIQPDIEVILPEALQKKSVAEIPQEDDTQLRRALEELKKKLK